MMDVASRTQASFFCSLKLMYGGLNVGMKHRQGSLRMTWARLTADLKP